MARNVYGLDLGTYDIKIFDKKKDRIWHAKNVIAMKDKKYIFSVGDDAYEMYEKAPGNIQIIFPMKNGVIARFEGRAYICPWSRICDRCSYRCHRSRKEGFL